jgi:hypothetical protein
MISWMNAGPDWLDGTITDPMAAEIAEEKHARRRIECELFADDGEPLY